MNSLYHRLKAPPDAASDRRPEGGAAGFPAPVEAPPAPGRGPTAAADRHRALKDRIRERLLSETDTTRTAAAVSVGRLADADAAAVRERIREFVRAEKDISPLEADAVTEALLDEIAGYGPIQSLLEDAEVTEIMVNSSSHVYVERSGKITRAGIEFHSDQEVLHLIERIVSPLGRRIDESSPMVDARLPDGSRVNAIIPPLAIRGPSVTIRKFRRDVYSAADLMKRATLTDAMAGFLEACVKARLNILVSGGTGSGKTTTLNILSSFIPSGDRVITIEDAAELRLAQEHVVALEARPPNVEGRGEITIRHLVRNALRMRPDRIIVGEVRGGEALDMLQAMNTGHDGSLTTGHANSPRDMLARLETMVLMAGMDLPVRAIREQVAAAIDIIVHQARMQDGSRKILSITEVQGMESEVITLQDIFVFRQTGVDAHGAVIGEFRPTGIRPMCSEVLASRGLALPPEWFGA
jgi:pilus assembly protein CpaF